MNYFSHRAENCGYFRFRIKIYVPEHIKHVHHHHVRKVPVYIVTKDKPTVMYASHIEDDFDDHVAYWKSTRSKTAHSEHDDLSIRGIYREDGSHVQEDIDVDQSQHVSPKPAHVEIKKHKLLPYVMTSSSSNNNKKLNYMLQRSQSRI